MEEKKKSIFRKSALNRLNGPEDIDAYIQVTPNGIWYLLGAIIAILIGILVWGIFGRLESKVNTVVESDNGYCVCYITEDEFNEISRKEVVLHIADKEYKVYYDNSLPLVLDKDEDRQLIGASLFEDKDKVYALVVENGPENGLYYGELVYGAISPISLLLN